LSRRRLDLLAIDLDGTLVDSAPDIAHCLGHALESIGLPSPGEALTRVWIGDGLETLLNRALAHSSGAHGGSAASVEKPFEAALAGFLSCYNANLFVRSRLYPGVVATLDRLQSHGIKLCCITNKRLSFSERLLVDAGVRDRFELLLGGDSLPEKKPSPLPLTVAAERLGALPAEAVLVGDSHQDLRAARSAGFGFVLASYGYGKIDETELGTSPRIRGFTDLPAALGIAV
jgi:phosphoglycolate phosphatase